MKELFNIENEELQEILKYVGDEPLFLNDEMRLLSKDEINNYKMELGIDIDNIVPLIDLFDNNFLIYNKVKNTFEKLNIVDETIYEREETIEKYLKLLRDMQ